MNIENNLESNSQLAKDDKNTKKQPFHPAEKIVFSCWGVLAICLALSCFTNNSTYILIGTLFNFFVYFGIFFFYQKDFSFMKDK